MASKRRLRRKQCDGKTKYKTQDDANKALGKFFTQLVSPMRAYKCKFCKYFHLGHFTTNLNIHNKQNNL